MAKASPTLMNRLGFVMFGVQSSIHVLGFYILNPAALQFYIQHKYCMSNSELTPNCKYVSFSIPFSCCLRLNSTLRHFKELMLLGIRKIQTLAVFIMSSSSVS